MVPRFEKRVKAYSVEISAVVIVLLVSAMGLSNISDLFTFILVPLAFLLVTIIPVILSKGQTYGKRIQKIKVVKLDGTDASTFILVLRELFKWIASIATFGIYMIIAYFAMSEKEVSRTIHDFIFKTKVIDLDKTPQNIKRNESFLGKSESLKKRGL